MGTDKKLLEEASATPSTSSTASIKHIDIYGISLKERDTIGVYDGNKNSPFYGTWLSAIVLQLRKDGKVYVYFTDEKIHHLNNYQYQTNGSYVVDEVKDA